MNYTSTMQTKTNGRSLPKGWRWVKFGDIIAESQPGFASGQRDSKGVIQLRMNNVDTRGNLIWDEFLRVPAEQTAIEKFGLKVGDVVFNNTNSTELVGKSALFTGYDEPVTYSNHFTRLRAKPDVADPGFITFWLISQWQAKTFANICNRWIGQSAVKTDKLFALEIPLPPLDEQRRIASRLNEQLAAVESARVAAEEQLQAANALRAAYIRQFVEDQVFQKWSSVKLGELLVETRNGLYKLEKFYGQGKRILKMYNIGRLDGTWNLKRVDLIDLTDKEYNDYRLEIGDILLNRVNSRELVGKSAVINEKTEGAVYESKNIRVRVDNTRVLSDFVVTYMNSKYGRVQFEQRLKQIVGQATVNRSDLDSFEIPLPPYNVQQKIISELKSKQIEIDNLEVALESQLAEISRLPASLLREAFAGQ